MNNCGYDFNKGPYFVNNWTYGLSIVPFVLNNCAYGLNKGKKNCE